MGCDIMTSAPQILQASPLGTSHRPRARHHTPPARPGRLAAKPASIDVSAGHHGATVQLMPHACSMYRMRSASHTRYAQIRVRGVCDAWVIIEPNIFLKFFRPQA